MLLGGALYQKNAAGRHREDGNVHHQDIAFNSLPSMNGTTGRAG